MHTDKKLRNDMKEITKKANSLTRTTRAPQRK